VTTFRQEEMRLSKLEAQKEPPNRNGYRVEHSPISTRTSAEGSTVEASFEGLPSLSSAGTSTHPMGISRVRDRISVQVEHNPTIAPKPKTERETLMDEYYKIYLQEQAAKAANEAERERKQAEHREQDKQAERAAVQRRRAREEAGKTILENDERKNLRLFLASEQATGDEISTVSASLSPATKLSISHFEAGLRALRLKEIQKMLSDAKATREEIEAVCKLCRNTRLPDQYAAALRELRAHKTQEDRWAAMVRA
jgi:hypothetical protein